MYKHIMLEVYCTRETNDEVALNCECGPNYGCIENKCSYVAFTTYENAICYVNEDSVSEKSIAFGGEMLENDKDLLPLWKDICSKKIDEAYETFMREKNY